MSEIKVGDDVMVRGKVEEVRETKTGKLYYIRIEEAPLGFNTVLVAAKAIVE